MFPLEAVLITMIAIAIQKPGNGHVDVTTKIDLATGFLAVTNIVFAYGEPISLGNESLLKFGITSRPCRVLRIHLGNESPH